MKRNLLLFLTIILVAFLSSCSGLYSYKKAQSASLMPDQVRLNLEMNDMELLGETTISMQTRTYLGIFKQIDFINGEVYNFRKVTHVQLNGDQQIKMPKDMEKAAYKVLQAYPNADYYVPVSSHEEVNRMFLGNSKTKTMVIKAYKFK